MKDERNIEEVLQRALPSAPRAQMESALDRVFARLQSDRGEAMPEPIVHVEATHRFDRRWIPLMAAVAAVLVAAVWVGRSWRDRGVYAVLETTDATVYRVTEGNRVLVRAGDRIGAREMVRSGDGAGAVLALADGSRVEMGSQSELALERANDGLSIRLHAGSIIVNAAKQPSGHLYVQTKDMTVAVVGTVFLVNAEEHGSRVAVIEGEVRVHEGAMETNLRPGEQVSTSPTLEARPMKEEIAWSRRADAHLALLSLSAQTQPIAGTPQFEEASVKPCLGGTGSFEMTPGRLHALCMTLATIIRTAYGYGPAEMDWVSGGGLAQVRAPLPGANFQGPQAITFSLGLNAPFPLGVEDGVRVRGGPGWVRSEGYTVDAVAEGPADADTMRGPMLRALLERRFQLKAHIEVEQVPGFALTVAKSGLRISPVEAGACTPRPPRTPGVPAPPPRAFADVRRGEKPTCGLGGQHNGPNMVFVGGETGFSDLATSLAIRLGGVHVIDKTGIADKFNFLLEFVLDENTPDMFSTASPAVETSGIRRGRNIFTALDEQLGLKLEPARAPREFIVIDRVQRPSPN